LQQENFIATKTPGHKGFFFLLFTNVFFHVPGVSEAIFLANRSAAKIPPSRVMQREKERRNTGGIKFRAA